MPAKVSGNKGIIPQPSTSFNTDRFGVDQITEIEELRSDLFPQNLKREGQAHPRFPTMALARRTGELGKAGTFYKITYLYEGFLVSFPAPVYNLSGGTGDEPIQTHPKFESDLAGTPSVPKNGAIFIDPETDKPTDDDENGVFDRFGNGDLEGIDSYRVSGATWKEMSFSNVRPSGGYNLGEKDSPSGQEPSFPGGRDWMLVGFTYSQRGYVFQVEKSWELSGRDGWNDLLY